MTPPTGTDLDLRCRDYHRMAKALTWLADHRDANPSLTDLAAATGLSPDHLQRVFTRWVGLSPKKFLQYLSLDHARGCLAASSSVLDAALAAGLSGPGRLHDLFVVHAGMTPGAFRRGGEGLVLQTGLHPTPFGTCLVARSERGVCALAFVDDQPDAARADLVARFPRARFQERPEATEDVVHQVFGSRGRITAGGPVALDLRGTPFQLQVWEALLQVPEGALVSYDGLARAMGRPGSARAVASAVAANPVGWAIPCHRVIRGNGLAGGYRWGVGRKLALMAWEAGRTHGG